MKKENKQLTSREDILSLWLEKGAMLKGHVINNIWRDEMIEDERYLWNVDMLDDGYSFDIYTLLYSEESNFFQIMFPSYSALLSKGFEEHASRPIELYDRKKNEDGEYWEFSKSKNHKIKCVTSPDPLQYLLSVLNTTT